MKQLLPLKVGNLHKFMIDHCEVGDNWGNLDRMLFQMPGDPGSVHVVVGKWQRLRGDWELIFACLNDLLDDDGGLPPQSIYRNADWLKTRWLCCTDPPNEEEDDNAMDVDDDDDDEDDDEEDAESSDGDDGDDSDYTPPPQT